MPRFRITTTDLSLFFGLPILAYSEWRFGVEVLGLPEVRFWGMTLSLALFVPGFLDTYVVAAMRRGGSEVGWALGLVVTSVTGSAIAHLYELTAEQKVLASALFGCALAVVIWRVKHIAHADAEPAPRAARMGANSQQECAVSATTAVTSDLVAIQVTSEQRPAPLMERFDRGPTLGDKSTAAINLGREPFKRGSVEGVRTTSGDEVARRRARRSDGPRTVTGRDEQAGLILAEHPSITGPELRKRLLQSGWSVSDRTGARILARLRLEQRAQQGANS